MRSVEPHVLATVGETLAARGYFQMILRRNGRAFARHRRRSVFDTLQTVLDMFRGRQPLSESRMALCLTQALTAMAEPAAPEISSNRTSLIDRAVGCISQRIGCEPSVGELARLVGWSEYHFIRVFREMMGVTPRRYIIVNRMNHARYLLKTTALPIGEIGGMVGYASESMFSAAFRRTHGITPQPVQNRRTASRTGRISMSTASIRVETVLIPTYGVGRADKNPMFLDTTRLYACASNAHDGWYGHRGGSDLNHDSPDAKHACEAVNTYPAWVYPPVEPVCPPCVHECRTLDDGALAVLEAGGTVSLSPDSTEEALPHSIQAQFSPDFWSVGTFPKQEGSMGQLIECRCRGGRLLISSMGLQHLMAYPEARALQQGIYRWLAEDAEGQCQEMTAEEVRTLVR